MDSEAAPARFGVYVHVPFCARRCDYCAFATWTDRSHLMEAYAAACVTELQALAVEGSLVPATSVFFGGGTPSLLPGRRLASILDAIERQPDAEVTVEVNPDTATPALFATYRAAGVNRVSFGVQSMVASVLASLGRSHTVANVAAGMAMATKAGFRTNLDLIYGAAGETMAHWRQTLDAVLALAPDHVSAYALTVEPGTPLAADPTRHPDDDDQADKYLLAEELLTAAGYASYEISNWSQPGEECRHNLLYWDQGDYRGIGCAAHSHDAGRRWWNVRTPERYLAAVTSGRSPEAAGEQLDLESRRMEGLQLALRTATGVPAGAVDAEGIDALLQPAGGGRVALTAAGRLLANEVALRLR